MNVRHSPKADDPSGSAGAREQPDPQMACAAATGTAALTLMAPPMSGKYDAPFDVMTSQVVQPCDERRPRRMSAVPWPLNAPARRRRATGVSVAAAATVAGILSVAALVSTGGDPALGPASPREPAEPTDPSGLGGTCAVGEERSVFRGRQGGESTSVLLACGQLDDGRKVELLSGSQSGGLCLQIVGIDSRVRECGNAPSEQEPPMTGAVAAQAIAQPNSSAALEVYGAVSTDVTTVSLRYTQGGSTQLARGELIHVKDRGALERAGIGEPFGYFVGELPAKASSVTAVAKDGEGRTLGRAGFEPLLRSQPRQTFISGPSR